MERRVLLAAMFFFGSWALGPRLQAQNLQEGERVPSDYLNAELPRSIRFSGEERIRFEGLSGIGFLPADNRYLLQRLRLNLEVKPANWLKFVFQAQDSRVFFTNVSPAPATQKNPMDLRIGYVQVGNEESGPVMVRAGRQDVTFGEGRLVGDPGWSNVGRTFDGVRAAFHAGKFRVDALSGISDKIYTDQFDTPTPGEHFHALYGSLTNVVPQSTIEPFFFWKLEHGVKGETVKLGNLDERTAGVHWVGKLPAGFDYGLETAWQRGYQANEPIHAWAGHFVLGHTFADKRHKPRLFFEFNRGSGDVNRKDGVHGGFDPVFIAAHDKFGLADVFAWTNLTHQRTGLKFKVTKSVGVTGSYNSYFLTDPHDGVYSGTKLLIASNGSQGTHVGESGELQGTWAMRKHTSADVTVGHIFPGEFLKKTGHDATYNFALVGLTQRF